MCYHVAKFTFKGEVSKVILVLFQGSLFYSFQLKYVSKVCIIKNLFFQRIKMCKSSQNLSKKFSNVGVENKFKLICFQRTSLQ